MEITVHICWSIAYASEWSVEPLHNRKGVKPSVYIQNVWILVPLKILRSHNPPTYNNSSSHHSWHYREPSKPDTLSILPESTINL